MIDRKIAAKLSGAALNLHRATDVRSDDGFGATGQDVASLAQTDLIRHLGLRQDIAACGTATHFGFVVGQELEFRNTS